jgi:hypothetical protein
MTAIHGSEADRALEKALRDERDLWRDRATEADERLDTAFRFAAQPPADLDQDEKDDGPDEQRELARQAEEWYADHDAHGQLNEAHAAARDRRIDALLAQARNNTTGGAT